MFKSASFQEVYKDCYPLILRLCRSYTNDIEEAEDLAQETFIVAWENWDRFRQESLASTWIYRIAINVCLTYIRKAKKQPFSRLENAPESESISNPSDGTEEDVQHLYHCINQLRPADRILITLVLEELPYLEIAAITGIKENTIAVKIHRIKKELTELYQRHERI